MTTGETVMDAAAVTGERVGFVPRLGATIIDWIILGVIGGILQRVLGGGVGGGLSTLVSIAYLLYFWTSTGQTLGHKLLGLKVTKTDGGPIDITTAIIRYVGTIIAAIPLGLGFLWVLWDAEKQGWHDKIAKTCVVRA
jgi:uncharacterized RDD family membrane protein YckC